MTEAREVPPTLIIIMDDVGEPWGLSEENTPGIMALREQATIHDLWVTPNCSATRAALFTRKYPVHNGVGTIIKHSASTGLEPNEVPPLPGRRAALFGKYHLCPTADIEAHPLLCGWYRFDGHAHNLGSGGSGGYSDWDHTMVTNGEVSGTMRSETYCPDVTLNACSQSMLSRQADFVVYAAALIHKPIHNPPGYPEATTADERRAHMLQRMDEDVTHLVGLASQLGYRCLLFSDNGADAGTGGGKGSLKQAGIRTDLMAFGFKLEPTRVDIVDLLSMCDGKLAGDAQHVGARGWHYSERFGPNGEGGAQHRNPDRWSWAVEQGRWKLIRNAPEHRKPGQLELELFNLKKDPGEAENMAAVHPHIVDRLSSLAATVQAG